MTYYTINWAALNELPADQRMAALARIGTDVQNVTSAERARMVHAARSALGTQKAAADHLGMKSTRINQLIKEPPMTVKITYTAPYELHRQYQGQHEPQPCYVEVDLDNETLMADYNSEVGSAVPPEVKHGFERRYTIPALASDAANDLLDQVKPLAERMVSDWEKVWDGNNHVAQLGDDAAAAEEEIEALCEGLGEDANTVTVWGLDGATNGDEVEEYGITAETTDERLEEIEEEIRASLAGVSDSGEVVLEGVDEYLRGLRDGLKSEADDDED